MAKRGSRKSTSASKTFTASADHRVVVLYGKEDFLLREYTRHIEEALRNAYGEFERFDFNGQDTTLANLLDELRSYGLMQQHKLVVLDEADKFLSPPGEDKGAKKDPRNRRALEDYAQNPVESATLLMRGSTWRPGNLDKYVRKVGTVHECKPPPQDKAVIWCRQRIATRYDADIDRPAAAALIELVGVSLSRLDSELQKLATYVGRGGTVSREDVNLLVGVTRDDMAWAIQDAISTGDPATAVRKLRELIDISQAEVVPLTWSVIDLTRKLHHATVLLRQGASPSQLYRPLKLWGSTGDAVLEVARVIEPARAAQLLQAAIETDRRTKTGIGNDRRSLEALTVRVADTMTRG